MFKLGHVRGMGENRDGVAVSRCMEKAIKKSDTWQNNPNMKTNQSLNASTSYA